MADDDAHDRLPRQGPWTIDDAVAGQRHTEHLTLEQLGMLTRLRWALVVRDEGDQRAGRAVDATFTLDWARHQCLIGSKAKTRRLLDGLVLGGVLAIEGGVYRWEFMRLVLSERRAFIERQRSNGRKRGENAGKNSTEKSSENSETEEATAEVRAEAAAIAESRTEKAKAAARVSAWAIDLAREHIDDRIVIDGIVARVERRPNVRDANRLFRKVLREDFGVHITETVWNLSRQRSGEAVH